MLGKPAILLWAAVPLWTVVSSGAAQPLESDPVPRRIVSASPVYPVAAAGLVVVARREDLSVGLERKGGDLDKRVLGRIQGGVQRAVRIQPTALGQVRTRNEDLAVLLQKNALHAVGRNHLGFKRGIHAARRIGCVCPRRILASGVLAPNKAAAMRAYAGPWRSDRSVNVLLLFSLER